MKKEITNILTLLFVFIGVVGIIVGSVLSNANSYNTMSLQKKNNTTIVMELEVTNNAVSKCDGNLDIEFAKSEVIEENASKIEAVDSYENEIINPEEKEIYIENYDKDSNPSCKSSDRT